MRGSESGYLRSIDILESANTPPNLPYIGEGHLRARTHRESYRPTKWSARKIYFSTATREEPEATWQSPSLCSYILTRWSRRPRGLLTMTVLKWEITPSSFGLLTMTVLKNLDTPRHQRYRLTREVMEKYRSKREGVGVRRNNKQALRACLESFTASSPTSQ